MSFSSLAINSRQLTTLFSFDNEFSLLPDKNYLFDLSYLSTLNVSGEKSAEFLQGQLSCDIRKVDNNTMRHGAMCNLKGRVLALLDIINWQGLHLVLPKDLISATQHSLNKAAMLSKVKLEEENQFHCYGFYLTNKDDLLPSSLSFPDEPFTVSSTDLACCYSLGQQLYLLLVLKEKASTLAQQFSALEQFRGSLLWHYLQLKRKKLEIYPETRGLFLPHRMDLHLSDYLSFDKGCYKGQEIIARTHYRAKPKHRLGLFIIESQETIDAGTKLLSPEGDKEMGELIDYCPMTNERYLIAASILLNAPKELLIEAHNNPVYLRPLD